MLINIVLTREPGPAEGEERGGGGGGGRGGFSPPTSLKIRKSY